MEQKNNPTQISTICVDLGGKNTGVLFTHGGVTQPPQQHSRNAVTLVYPEAGLNLSQQGRLVKRHQRRGFKRRRLSKRLFQLILRQNYRGNDEDFQKDFQKDFQSLRTFLNRRGYTYLTLEDAEAQEEFLESLQQEVVEAACEHLGLRAGVSILKQLEKNEARAMDWYQDLNAKIYAIKDQKVKPEFVEKTNQRQFDKALNEIRNYCEQVLKSEKEGHKTRSEYIENIRNDFKNPEFTDLLSRMRLSTDEAANLVGHIANMQLRVLRRYFNDEKMATKDYWDEARLKKIFLRHLASWHVVKHDIAYANREKLSAAISTQGFLQALLKEAPNLSIPPFEDQNNRRVPRCRTLHIDATALDREYPQWKEYVQSILAYVGNEYEMDAAASELSIITDAYEKSAGNSQYNKDKPGKDKPALAVLLQRILDRSKDADKFQLRTLVRVSQAIAEERGDSLSEGDKKRHTAGITELSKALGSDEAARTFIELCTHYYQEVEHGKRGIWLDGASDNLCYRCDRKPKQKKNLKHSLIDHILGTALTSTPEAWVKWEEFYKQKATLGRSSISGVCKNIEETRKDMGDQFHVEWNRVKYMRKLAIPKEKTVNKKSSEMEKILTQTEAAAHAMQTHFKHSDKDAEKYHNPYSLAQIYNIMEGEIGGFQSTCTGCTHDNFWRSSRATATNETAARASRLSADTMRPFDGYLARYLERIAQKIATEKWRTIEKSPENSAIHVPIILEQNRFSFNADLAEMKDTARKKQAKEKLVNAEEREHDKSERIRKASKGICPYTGQALGKSGEFDHILPRSFSQSAFGAVFNSEMNLIYCSSEGNRRKSNKQYRLADLNAKYLQAIFGTSKVEEIRQEIAKTLGKFTRDEPVYFSNLGVREQRDFRHALFDDELSRRILPLLHTEFKMRVSGMQGYLARMVYQKLIERNEYAKNKYKLTFTVLGYDASDSLLYRRRENLAVFNSAYAKPTATSQAPGSHVIDATMAWAHALDRGDVPGLPIDLILEEEALEELLPESLQIVSLESRKQYRRKRPQTMAIFKDTIYAERYLSFIVSKKSCGFGYDMKNMCVIPEGSEEMFFDLIKPVALFRAEPIKKALGEYREKLGAKKKFIYFNINRQQAARLQQEIFHKATPTETELNQLALLQGIRYTTQKKDVLGTMSDQANKAVAFPEKKLNEFMIKIDFGVSVPDSTRKLKIAGQVKLPQRDAWEVVVADKLVKKNIKEGKKWSDLNTDEESDFRNRHFRQSIKNPNAHHGVRKIYSLPLIDGPSGGFRIHRKHGTDEHFQLQAKDGSTYAGFAIDENDVRFDRATAMPFLQQASLTPVSGTPETLPKKILYMDEWREIPLEKIDDTTGSLVAVYMQPNSDSRAKLRVRIKSEALVIDTARWHLTAPGAFNTAKHSNEKEIQKVEKKIAGIFASLQLKPRDGKIQLVAVDKESTTFEFVVQGTSVLHKDWYNTGTPI